MGLSWAAREAQSDLDRRNEARRWARLCMRWASATGSVQVRKQARAAQHAARACAGLLAEPGEESTPAEAHSEEICRREGHIYPDAQRQA